MWLRGHEGCESELASSAAAGGAAGVEAEMRGESGVPVVLYLSLVRATEGRGGVGEGGGSPVGEKETETVSIEASWGQRKGRCHSWPKVGKLTLVCALGVRHGCVVVGGPGRHA